MTQHVSIQRLSTQQVSGVSSKRAPGVSGPERLSRLGISIEAVTRSLRRADAAGDDWSPLDPPILHGLLRWARTTRYLREELVPAGWSFDNPRNLARTIHPSGEFAIVVATGDDQTGRPDAVAAPRHPRGYATEQAVNANNQLTFDFGLLLQAARAETGSPIGGIRTWLLLFATDEEFFHVELSLPETYDDGRITSWTERILLPPIPRERTATRPPDDPWPTVDIGGVERHADRGGR
ncbi:hypothetical protein ACVBEQ_18575 [Nakamurella sp. GG22]